MPSRNTGAQSWQRSCASTCASSLIKASMYTLLNRMSQRYGVGCSDVKAIALVAIFIVLLLKPRAEPPLGISRLAFASFPLSASYRLCQSVPRSRCPLLIHSPCFLATFAVRALFQRTLLYPARLFYKFSPDCCDRLRALALLIVA